jgi:hypothetical protein
MATFIAIYMDPQRLANARMHARSTDAATAKQQH